jgi:hypothetical protein
MIDKLKKWWFKVTHVKCDYCKEPCDVWYEAYLFPVKEYKGMKICTKCIDELPSQENIIRV